MRLPGSKSASPGLITLFLLWCMFERGVSAQLYFTIDDTDTGIVYKPTSSWKANTAACTACLKPKVRSILNNSWMDGSHVTMDEDDAPSPSNTSVPAGTSNKATPAPTPTPSPKTNPPPPTAPPPKSPPDNDDDPDDDPDEHHDGKKEKEKGPDTDRRRGLLPRLDKDDKGFIDTPVTAEFKFNGSAVWVYAIQPEMLATNVLVPTNMNLSFTLDNIPFQPYLHTPTSGGTGFTPNVTVFSADNLDPINHVLLVTVAENTVFLFDYLVYQQDVGPPNTGDAAVNQPTPAKSKRGVVTFALAVGIGVGFLGIMSIATFLRIYLRRRKSLKRERSERDQERAQPMVGPRPFIPRYFPGTVPPPYTALSTVSSSTFGDPDTSDTQSIQTTNSAAIDPVPTYNPTLPVNHIGIATSVEGSVSTETTYADIPPATPPPLIEDVVPVVLLTTPRPLEPPPTFGEAVSSPLPSLLRGAYTPIIQSQILSPLSELPVEQSGGILSVDLIPQPDSQGENVPQATNDQLDTRTIPDPMLSSSGLTPPSSDSEQNLSSPLIPIPEPEDSS